MRLRQGGAVIDRQLDLHAAVLPVAVAAALAAALAAVLLARITESVPAWQWQAGAVVVSAALLVVALLTARRERSERRRLRLTDPVTGLGNRTALLEELRRAAESGTPTLLVVVDVAGFTRYNERHGHVAGDDLLVRLAERLRRSLPPGPSCYRTFGGEFALVAGGPDDVLRHALPRRAADALASACGTDPGPPRYGWATLPRDARSAEEALDVASRRLSAAARHGSDPATQATAALVQALAQRDPALALHLAGVAELAVAVARRLGLGEDEAGEIGRAARLLEVGMLTVPLAVLRHPGPLDESELALIRRHTIAGERIVAAAPALASCAALIRSSHERYDGGGYPDGLSGRSIPLGARVLAVCDAFAAMVTDRPYRRSLSYQAAIVELRRCAGTQFDPAVVGALLDELDDEHSVLAHAV